MKRIIVFALLTTCINANSQNPVKWSFTAKKIADKTYELHLTAAVPSPWTIYSQTTPDGGPVATSIRFSKNPLIVLDGKIKELGTMKKKHEKVFGVNVHYQEREYSIKFFENAVSLKVNSIVEIAMLMFTGEIRFLVQPGNDDILSKFERVPKTSTGKFNLLFKDLPNTDEDNF